MSHHTDPFDTSYQAKKWVACGATDNAPAPVGVVSLNLSQLSQADAVVNTGRAPTTGGSTIASSSGPSLSAATATTAAAPGGAAPLSATASGKAKKKANAFNGLCRNSTTLEEEGDEEMAFAEEADGDAAKAKKKGSSFMARCVPPTADDADANANTTNSVSMDVDGAAFGDGAKKKSGAPRFPCVPADAVDENKERRAQTTEGGAATSRSCLSGTFEGNGRGVCAANEEGDDQQQQQQAGDAGERTARHSFGGALCGGQAPTDAPVGAATTAADNDAESNGDMDEAAELHRLQTDKDDPFFCCCGDNIAAKDPRLLQSQHKKVTASTRWVGNPDFADGGCRAWCSRLHWPSVAFLVLMTLSSFFVTIAIVFPVYQTQSYVASRTAPHEVWTIWMHCTETRLSNQGSLVGKADGGTHCHTWPEGQWECADIKSRYNAARVFGVSLIVVSLGAVIAAITHALRIYRFPSGPIILLALSFLLTIFSIAATTSIWQVNTCNSGARMNDPNLRIGEAPYFYMVALLLQAVSIPVVIYMLYFPSARLRSHNTEVDPERGAFTTEEQQRREELKREFPTLINEDVVGREVRVGDYVRQLASADYVTSAPPTALSVSALGATAPEMLSARDAQPTTRRDSARTAPTPIANRYLTGVDGSSSGRPPMPSNQFSGVVPANASTPQQQLQGL